MSEKRMTSDHRKLCILRAVRGLFSKKGLNVTSKELSQAAGVSEALIYKHFNSKEGLYNSFLDSCCGAHAPLGEELSEREPSTLVLVCALKLMIHVNIHGMQTPDDDIPLTPEEVRGLILQSYLTDGEFARTLFGRGLDPWVSAIVEAMNASIKAGEMTPPPRQDLKTLIWLAHHSILGIKLSRHPQPDAFMAPAMDDDEVALSSLHFTLLGMGVHPDAIQRTLKDEFYIQFSNKLKNNSKETTK